MVVDDALTGVTEVVRGRDLLLSTPQQMHVAQLLGFPTMRFTHHPLLCNGEGQRLSKRDKSYMEKNGLSRSKAESAAWEA